jgi:N6-L-threonylcarbamoyladenine synthase/protein kinase Bud32
MPVFGRILGIEGTAWNLSAAVFENDLISLYSKPYRPPKGGIHPREAAQHHASEMKAVISKVLTKPGTITGVAYSQGPGLGPCLRTVATAARSLAIGLGVPLVGVNHCVAHIEIGRFATGCSDPIVLYASGANTQVIGYLNRRYRIFGETLDIGIGNAIDKFARSKGLPHPGGPAIEELAKTGGYVDLPYTVKGMDLAFSGLVSSARACKAPIADVCYSLQETAFAMCTEVTERALAHTGKEEVLLVGGVGANSRLQEMLSQMCNDRGAVLFVPEHRYLGDNGAMIAYTGRIMLESGYFVPPGESYVNPSYRSDQVEVTWRHDDPGERIRAGTLDQMTRATGAEAEITLGKKFVEKRRVRKGYRRPELDARLITERTRAEARLIAAARKSGVPTPVIHEITGDMIRMERIYGSLMKDTLRDEFLEEAGRTVGNLHRAGIVHGDLTTSNMVMRDGRCVLIDFGLAGVSSEIEARGVDLHVLFQTLESTADHFSELKEAFSKGYKQVFDGACEVLLREGEIEKRGRYL